MKKSKYIRLLPVLGRGAMARGHVLTKTPKETPVSMTVRVLEPPAWLRGMEKKRGIFSRMPMDLYLFIDHTGNWTDVGMGEHFKIV